MAAYRPTLIALLLGLLALSYGATAESAAQPRTHPEVVDLLLKGGAARRAGDRNLEMALYRQALEKARELQDVRGEAGALDSIALVYVETGRPREALEFLGRALPLWGRTDDRGAEAWVLFTTGGIYSRLGQPEKALTFYLDALPLYRRANSSAGEAWVIKAVVGLHYHSGTPDKAREFVRQALASKREARDGPGEIETLNSIADAYAEVSETQEAARYREEALAACRRTQDSKREAATLNSLGRLYSAAGQLEPALARFREALALYRTLNDPDGEGSALMWSGEACAGLGLPHEALRYLQQAAVAFQRGDLKVGQGWVLLDVGEIYLELGDEEQALACYRRALPLHRAGGNREGIAAALTWGGRMRAKHGAGKEGLEQLQEALELFRGIRSKEGEGWALKAMGDAYAAQSQPQRSGGYYERALQVFRETGNRVAEAGLLADLGQVYREVGRPQEALRHARDASRLAREIGSRWSEARSLRLLALLQQDQGQAAAAERDLRASLSLTEALRESLAGRTDAKLSFLEAYLGHYHEHVELLLRMNRPADAFTAVQRTKARVLLDLLRNGRVDLYKHVTEAERQQEQALRRRADELNARMVSEGVRNEPGSKRRFAALKEELSQAEGELRSFRADLYTRYPDLADQRAARTLEASQVAQFLPPDTALLEYAVLQGAGPSAKLDRTVLFAVTVERGKTRVAAHAIPLTRRTLATRVGAFRAACADPRRPYLTQGRDLYRLLVGPAARQIAGKRRLIVCPDGPLWDLPFAALRTGAAGAPGRERFLVEQAEIAYAYSATGAQAAVLAGAERKGTRPPGAVLVLANPAFGEKRFGDTPGVTGQRPIDVGARPIEVPARGPLDLARDAEILRVGRIVELPGTQREADTLKRDYPNAVVYTRERAQEATAKSEAGKYRYVHFATHGFFNDAAPLLSSIVLAQPAAATEDGFLTAREIFELDLKAELVVLSACNTARGEKRSGEGLIGLTWALFAAGAPTQVMSQWAVDDASTARLMASFYSGIRSGRPTGEALRRASLSLLRGADRKRRHPYYWAPFVLLGDWGTSASRAAPRQRRNR